MDELFFQGMAKIKHQNYIVNLIKITCARGVMVIIVGNGHGDTSSKPGRD